MKLHLEEKVVVISGSSRGIGLAIAESFLTENARVVITGRDENSLNSASQFLTKKFGAERLLAFKGNMNSEQEATATFEKTISVFGQVNSVVANVGSGSGSSGWELKEEEWISSINVNLLGAMTFSRVALKYLGNHENSNLTFISSIVGCEGLNAPLPYSAAKAAINSVVKNLSRMVGQQGIRVNAVAPGNILFSGGTWEKKMQERPDFFSQYIQNEVPLKRFGKPEEIADAVVFLSSPKASFITGACLVIDGGQTRSW